MSSQQAFHAQTCRAWVRTQVFLGQKSQLVWQVFRVLDMRRDVRIVMIENSPRLLNDGLSLICDEFQRRDFHFAWGIFPAARSGCPPSP